ncbi:family 10 glycosylhydrolase [soil metagenome]
MLRRLATHLPGLLLLGACAVTPAPTPTPPSADPAAVVEVEIGEPPPLQREFRGVWVASVANIDWPSRRDLSSAQQQAELLAILDRAVALNLNAVIFQVRPGGDALYASPHEPWSEYLTGRMGRAPEPFYDPLEFAVREAHRRGLELHAWFNPYRARHPSARSEVSANHLSRTRPELVRSYGKHLWMDPGEAAVREHTLRVILDVVQRYDIDGVHIDDYFYPYRERDAAGREIPFPDGPSWSRYVASGGRLSRNDWRRHNVDLLVEQLYEAIKREKPWVKFGISPLGIWRPGYPAQIRGLDAYHEIYADARKWLVNGWLDYFTPQLYWPIAQTPQSYPVLLDWWVGQNQHGRHIWPGNFTSRVGEGTWSAGEILGQIYVTRGQEGATGNVHFSMRALMQNRDSLFDRLSLEAYAEPALPPPTPWLGEGPPTAPAVTLQYDTSLGQDLLTLDPADQLPPAWWVVRTRYTEGWKTEILPGWHRTHRLTASVDSGAPLAVAVSGVDRNGNEGPLLVLRSSR